MAKTVPGKPPAKLSKAVTELKFTSTPKLLPNRVQIKSTKKPNNDEINRFFNVLPVPKDRITVNKTDMPQTIYRAICKIITSVQTMTGKPNSFITEKKAGLPAFKNTSHMLMPQKRK